MLLLLGCIGAEPQGLVGVRPVLPTMLRLPHLRLEVTEKLLPYPWPPSNTVGRVSTSRETRRLDGVGFQF